MAKTGERFTLPNNVHYFEDSTRPRAISSPEGFISAIVGAYNKFMLSAIIRRFSDYIMIGMN